MQGTPLPVNDNSKWTLQQKHVFEKALKKGNLPDAVKKAWTDAKGSNDKDRQREIVNSTVDREAGYSYEVNVDLGDASCQQWIRSVEGTTESKRTEKETGVSLSAIEVKYRDNLQRALERGDVWEEDGLYYEKTSTRSKTKKRKETLALKVSGELNDTTMGKLMAVLEDYEKTPFSQASEKITIASATKPPSDEARGQLQTAYDAMIKCQRNVQGMMTGLAAGTQSDTVKVMVQRAREYLKDVRSYEEEAMIMLCDVECEASDKSIWALVHRAQNPFEKLVELEEELKMFMNKKMREEKVAQTDNVMKHTSASQA